MVGAAAVALAMCVASVGAAGVGPASVGLLWPTSDPAGVAWLSRHDATGVWSMGLSNGVTVRTRRASGGTLHFSALLAGGAALDAPGARALSEAVGAAWASGGLRATEDHPGLTPSEMQAWLARWDLEARSSSTPEGLRLEVTTKRPDRLPLAAQVLGALLTRPRLDAGAVVSWRAEQSAERAAAISDTRAALRVALDRATSPDGGAHFGPMDAGELAGVTPESAQAWLDGAVGEWATDVVVVGYPDHRWAFDAARTALGGVVDGSARVPASPEVRRGWRSGTRPAGPVRVEVTARTGPALAAVGFHAPEGGDLRDASRLAEVRRMVLAKEVLSERLGAALEPGAPGVNLAGPAYFDPRGAGATTGLVWVITGGPAGSSETGAGVVWSEIERLASDGPTPEELERAVASALEIRGEDGESGWYWARVLEAAGLRGLSMDALARTEPDLRAITPEEVRAALAAWSSPTRRFTVLVEPE